MELKSEIFDKLQFLFETCKFNDHVLHFKAVFSGKINEAFLIKAINFSIKIYPILSCVFVEKEKEPYWIKKEFCTEDIITITKDKDIFNNFITRKISESYGPQVKFCLYGGATDTLAINMNHMVCDAAGFKDYIYVLCDIYSKLYMDVNYVPNFINNKDRSLNSVINKFNISNKLSSLVFQSNESNKNSTYIFPMEGGKAVKPFILTYNINENRYDIIKRYCKDNDFTINDAMLAAYYRALYRFLHIEEDDLCIPIMVDMRKYLKDKRYNYLSNLTSIAVTKVSCHKGDKFKDTAIKVKKDMDYKKQNNIGLNGFLKISAAFKLLNFKTIKKYAHRAFKNPLIGMTNIGIIDEKKLNFKGTLVIDAYMCGSIKYPPYFQLALTTFKSTITFSVNLYGTLKDRENINKFFNLLNEELPK